MKNKLRKVELEAREHIENEVERILQMQADSNLPALSSEYSYLLPPLLGREQRRISIQRIPFIAEQEMLKMERGLMKGDNKQALRTKRSEMQRERVNNVILRCNQLEGQVKPQRKELTQHQELVNQAFEEYSRFIDFKSEAWYVKDENED